MIELYDYQERYIEEIKKHFANCKKRLILCSATGSGKTVMFSYMTKQAFDKSELFGEITRTKKELAFANKQLHHNKTQ